MNLGIANYCKQLALRGLLEIPNFPTFYETINSWLDNDFGFKKHYVRGKAKIQTRVGLATAVIMAMALGHVKTGRIEQMDSLVRPTARSD